MRPPHRRQNSGGTIPRSEAVQQSRQALLRLPKLAPQPPQQLQRGLGGPAARRAEARPRVPRARRALLQTQKLQHLEMPILGSAQTGAHVLGAGRILHSHPE